MKPTCTSLRPVLTSSNTIAWHSVEDCESGFSQSTGFPAARQASVKGPWVWSGLAISTASTDFDAITAMGSVSTAAAPA